MKAIFSGISIQLWMKFLIVLSVAVFVIVESLGHRNDLDIFLAASEDLFNGGAIYTEKYFGIYNYFYSVLFATILYPLTFLPVFFAKLIWLTAGVVMIWRIISLLFKFIPEWKSDDTKRWLLISFLILFSLRFLKSNLHLGQVNHWLLWLTLEAIWFIYGGKWFKGAFLLSSAINIKLLPLVFLPYLLYRKHYRALMMTILFLVVFYSLPSLWVGWERNTTLLRDYWALIDPSQSRHVFDHEETSFHSLTSFVSTLFMENVREHNGLQMRRHILSLSAAQIEVLIWLLRIFFVSLTVYFLRSWPFKQEDNKTQVLYEVSYLIMIAPLIFPHQQHYAFIAAMPGVFWLLNVYLKKKIISWKLIPFTLVYLSFNLAFWHGGFSPWLNHFKILTWGILILIFLMAIDPPERRLSAKQ